MTSLRALLALVALTLPACSGSTDINGTYSGTLSRSLGCGVSSPTSATAEVEIVDTASEHVVHIRGAQPCDFVFEVTDYGGVGTVTDVKAGCAWQPEGMEFAGGTFSPSDFTLAWMDAGGSAACVVTDSWTLEN